MFSRRTIMSLFGLAPAVAIVGGAAHAADSSPRIAFAGKCLNVEARRVCARDLIFQASHGAAHSISPVRDGGWELVIDGDDCSERELSAAEIDPGHVRTCLAQGLFRLGGPPAFVVTADVTAERPFPLNGGVLFQ